MSMYGLDDPRFMPRAKQTTPDEQRALDAINRESPTWRGTWELVLLAFVVGALFGVVGGLLGQ